MDDLRQRLIDNGMNIKLTDAAYDKIVAEGTDLTNGARPLRRAIQKLIEDPLSEELLAGEWARAIPSCATWPTASLSLAAARVRFRHRVRRVRSGAIPLPAAPYTGNAAPVSGGVSSGPGGIMQAGSGAL